MAKTFPAASAVTAGSGPDSGPASVCWPSAVPSAEAGAGWPTAAVLPARSAAGFQVSAMPGLLPLTRVAVPFFSCASRACLAAAVLMPTRPAITATFAPAGSAARTAAAGLPTAAEATAAGAGSVAVSGRCGAHLGRGAGACHDRDSVLLFSGAITVLIFLRRCFLDDNFFSPDAKSSGLRQFQFPFFTLVRRGTDIRRLSVPTWPHAPAGPGGDGPADTDRGE
jgi:hypothetical protein